jgi:hypothetical protein
MLYALKMCVLTLMVFLAVLTASTFAFFAWPNGKWGILNTLMTGWSVLLFASSWYLVGCYRFIKKPERRCYPNDNSPHTIIGQGEYRKEYRD